MDRETGCPPCAGRRTRGGATGKSLRAVRGMKRALGGTRPRASAGSRPSSLVRRWGWSGLPPPPRGSAGAAGGVRDRAPPVSAWSGESGAVAAISAGRQGPIVDGGRGDRAPVCRSGSGGAVAGERGRSRRRWVRVRALAGRECSIAEASLLLMATSFLSSQSSQAPSAQAPSARSARSSSTTGSAPTRRPARSRVRAGLRNSVAKQSMYTSS